MKKIFEPVEMKNLQLKNRLIRSATWEGIAKLDGGIDAETYEIYSELAKGGVGAIITGFTSVAKDDYYFEGMMRLSDDKLIPQYKKLVEIAHAENCPIIAQLALGAYYRDFDEVEVNEMTAAEVEDVIQKFIDAAKRAEVAGFDGIQIHAAHFFFLSRFISPLVNQRTDKFGGSTENRIRILLEILNGIKNNSPSLHVTIKINCSDFHSGGIDEAESLAICKSLAAAGIDSIEVSGNGTSIRGIRAGVNEGYFAPFAIRLAEEIEIPVICVGGWRSKIVMEKVLDATKIAAFSISRPLLREPDFPNKLQRGETEISKCVSCNACYSSPSHRCIFRR